MYGSREESNRRVTYSTSGEDVCTAVRAYETTQHPGVLTIEEALCAVIKFTYLKNLGISSPFDLGLNKLDQVHSFFLLRVVLSR